MKTTGPGDPGHRKILLLDKTAEEFTPLVMIPDDYVKFLLPNTSACYEGDQDRDMFYQIFRLQNMTILGHHIFTTNDITLLTFPPSHTVSLHFMYAGSRQADIEDSDLLSLAGTEANIFSLLPEYYMAPLVAGQHIFSFCINMRMDTLRQMAEEHPDLKVLTDKKTGSAGGPLNNFPCTINAASRQIIREIISCRYVEAQADSLLQRCCINLFCNFARQEQLASKPTLPLSLIQKLEEALKYLGTNLSNPFSEKEIADLCGLTVVQFIEGFEQQFGISVPEYVLQKKMTAAYHLLLQSKDSLRVIALKLMFRSQEELVTQFERYFKCSPNLIRNCQ